MSLTSLSFLFFFLPLSLAVYALSGDGIKEFVLLGISLIFYALGSPEYFLLFLVLAGLTVMLGRLLDGAKSRIIRRTWLILGIFCNLAPLLFFKYAVLRARFPLFTPGEGAGSALMPLGISFYTFKAISYLADVYTGRAVPGGRWSHDLLYLSFFGQIQSGPITRIGGMRFEGFTAHRFSEGVKRLMIGCSKKILLANMLARITGEIFAMPPDSLSTMAAWAGSFCYSLQLFFDFAGYSDMAVGLTEMFGYSCMENFNYPYMTESVSNFWRRWHISLSEWFRDYVYIPLGGSRSSKKGRVYLNLLAVWLLTGIWHGASWQYLAWGLGFFAAISFERLTGLPKKLMGRVKRGLYRVLVLLFINFEWVLFYPFGLSSALKFIGRMLVPRAQEMADLRTAFLLRDNLFFVLAALLLCFPIFPRLEEKLKEGRLGQLFTGLSALLILALFIWSISFVLAGQNNPFAYAGF